MQKSFDEKNIQMLHYVINKLDPEVSVYEAEPRPKIVISSHWKSNLMKARKWFAQNSRKIYEWMFVH